jgi:hypothetical protein
MLLPHHAHYVSCSQFVLYVFISFAKFADAENCYLFFPFQLQTSLSAAVVLGGKFVLINKRALFFSQ